MRAKPSLSLLVFMLTVAATQSSQGQIREATPLTTTQVVAWLTGGVSSARLAQLVGARGLCTLPTQTELRQVEADGLQAHAVAFACGTAEPAAAAS